MLLSLPSAATAQGEPRVVGRWDLRVQGANSAYPSWLEITTSGNKTLASRFVGRFGGARPIARVVYAHDTLRFAIPPQWDRDTDQIIPGITGGALDADGGIARADPTAGRSPAH
jgi:hypothetical protein